METKICNTCNQELSINKFNKFKKSGKEYYRNKCNACTYPSSSKSSNSSPKPKQAVKNETKPIKGQLKITDTSIKELFEAENDFTADEIVILKIIAEKGIDILKLLSANDSQSIHTSSQLGANKFATENHNRLKKSYNVNEFLVNWVRTYSQQNNISASDVVNQAIGEYCERIMNECEQMNKK